MEHQGRKISLGFTNEKFEAGIHICQIFNEDDERHNALVNFVISGLQAGEKVACFSEEETESTLSSFFEKNGLSYQAAQNSDEFSLMKTGDVYFEDEKFEPERMLQLLQAFYQTSVNQNLSGARVIGEMLPKIDHIPGGSRLLEYESKVSLLVKKYPINAVCQYDARAFDGATIMDVLKVHPYMIIRGSVVRNPFFISPEEFLAKSSSI
jgi:hypothetical protein